MNEVEYGCEAEGYCPPNGDVALDAFFGLYYSVLHLVVPQGCIDHGHECGTRADEVVVGGHDIVIAEAAVCALRKFIKVLGERQQGKAIVDKFFVYAALEA